jgi:hypothetical protein
MIKCVYFLVKSYFHIKAMCEYLCIFVLIVMWIYSSICLFCVGISGNCYIQNIPIIDNLGTYQVYNFIPLCMFTSYFDKKIYINA